MSTATQQTRNSPQHPAESRPPEIIASIIWHGLLAAFLVFVSVNVLRAETLIVAGRPANLGKPVQVFAGLIVLVPAAAGLIASWWMVRRNGRGRYLALVVNIGTLAVAGFALADVWGFFDVFERIVDVLMANGTLLLGFALAYALYWLAGRLDEANRIRRYGELFSVGLAMLTLIFILFRGTIGNENFESFSIVDGVLFVLSRYIDPDSAVLAWVLTLVTLTSAVLAWRILQLGEYFGETPDERVAWQGWFMLAPNVIGFSLFFAGPLLLSFYLSFTDSSVGQIPQVIAFDNYRELLSLEIQTTTNPDVFAQDMLSFGYSELGEIRIGETRIIVGALDRFFWIGLGNTLVFCLLLLPLSILPAIGMALILNSKLPGVKFFRALYFLPSVAAVVGTALIWRWLYTPITGYINYAITQITNFLGVPDPEIGWLSDPAWVLISIVILAAWRVVGYNTVLILAGLQGIPNVLYEAAKIDGANRRAQFFNVTLPMLQPTLFFVIITTMVEALQVFNEPFALFPARPIPENATTSVYFMYTQGFFEFQFGYASAVAWILFAIIFSVTLLQFRLSRNQAYD